MTHTRSLIITFIFMFYYSSLLFSQQYIQNISLDKDSINRIDQLGKQGIWYHFNDSTGLIYNKTTYRNDLKHGTFEEYNSSGIMIKQGFYKDGMLDSIYREYWDDEKWISIYFDYGIPKGIVSESGKMIYKIKCNKESKGTFAKSTTLLIKDGDIISASEDMINNMTCNDTNDNAIYSFSYYDEEQSIDYFTTWKGKRCSFCPRLDTIYDFGIVSIYYNGCLYEKIYFHKKKRYSVNFFIDEKITKIIIYYLKKPYDIKNIVYYNKEQVYKIEYYNKKGILKKTEFIKDGNIIEGKVYNHVAF